MIILWLLFLVVGFVLLIKGADYFVDGSSSLAKKLGVSSLVIGLTIVAMGTSLPELMVSVTSSLQGSNGLSYGNVVGSNIFNTLAILGVTAIIVPLAVKKSTIYKEIPFMVMVTAITMILAFDNIFHRTGDVTVINWSDGVILLLLFVVYLYYLFGLAKQSQILQKEEEDEVDGMKILTTKKSWLLIGGGLVGVLGGGMLVVKGASEAALVLGMSETMVGLTIVALGTSLPELVTSIVAARKGKTDLAIGNVVGSNIFNLLLVLGLSSLASPLTLENNLIVDIIFLLVVSGLLWLAAKTRGQLNKLEGVIFVLIYVGYVVFVIGRNYWGWGI